MLNPCLFEVLCQLGTYSLSSLVTAGQGWGDDKQLKYQSKLSLLRPAGEGDGSAGIINTWGVGEKRAGVGRSYDRLTIKIHRMEVIFTYWCLKLHAHSDFKLKRRLSPSMWMSSCLPSFKYYFWELYEYMKIRFKVTKYWNSLHNVIYMIPS